MSVCVVCVSFYYGELTGMSSVAMFKANASLIELVRVHIKGS